MNALSLNNNIIFLVKTPHRWLSVSAFKTGRRGVPDLIPGRACQPSRSEFTVVFSVLTYIRAKIP